jgi:cytochrome c-type biogenesis protein CcmF
MIPELGQFALVLALCVVVAQGVLPLVGAARGNEAWMAFARPAAHAQLALIIIAYACLTYAFVVNDFSVLYVASNSNSQLPLFYRIAAVWGGHEGSLLLWMLMLAGWTVAVGAFSRRMPEEFVARVLGVMGLVSIGFLAFTLFTSNPFERLLPPAADGRDLNPLLQDPGMIFHPPLLYMGYVGFSVSFAFAIAALLQGRLDATWARWSRPWTTAAWVSLTLGILLGSVWAYYELGWGGWWFWDPVENASFLPWLVGTALIHSLAVTEKRGAFKAWTVFLAILAFSLSLLGTFLVRSGVLTSVHAFATDPKRGMFILAFLTLVVGGSLALYAWRAPRVRTGGAFELASREGALLANNVLLVVAAGAVLLGTLYPLALDALNLGKISVGPPYFDTVFVPLMAPVIFLMGVGPIMRWKNMPLPELAVRLRWAFAVSVASALVLPFVFGRWSALLALGFLLAVWAAATCVVSLARRLRQADAEDAGGIWGRLRSFSRSYYGMLAAHFGIAVFVAGVTLVNGYESETQVRMEPGQTVALAGYVFRFDGVREVERRNYVAARATMPVTRNGRHVTVLHPEKRFYPVREELMTEAAINARFTRDLYVSLGDQLSDSAWLVHVQHKPFIMWLWIGVLLMGFGGLLAVSDRRYRLGLRQPRAAQPADALAKAGAASKA